MVRGRLERVRSAQKRYDEEVIVGRDQGQEVGGFMNDLEVIEILRATRSDLRNLAEGKWRGAKRISELVSPLWGVPMLRYPDTGADEFEPFLAGLRSCPKYGLHNPKLNSERYLMLGEVSFRAAVLLENEKIADYFALLIQAVMPKSYAQCIAEVRVVRQFLKNFSGDRV